VTLSRPRNASLRVARWFIEFAATGALAIIMLRLLYTTPVGISLVDCIPETFWTRYHALVGLDNEGGVETLQDADTLVLLLGCLPFAAALVFLLEWVLLKMRKRSGETV
jgi:hypothetical protein